MAVPGPSNGFLVSQGREGDPRPYRRGKNTIKRKAQREAAVSRRKKAETRNATAKAALKRRRTKANELMKNLRTERERESPEQVKIQDALSNEWARCQGYTSKLCAHCDAKVVLGNQLPSGCAAEVGDSEKYPDAWWYFSQCSPRFRGEISSRKGGVIREIKQRRLSREPRFEVLFQRNGYDANRDGRVVKDAYFAVPIHCVFIPEKKAPAFDHQQFKETTVRCSKRRKTKP